MDASDTPQALVISLITIFLEYFIAGNFVC